MPNLEGSKKYKYKETWQQDAYIFIMNANILVVKVVTR